MYNYYKYIKEKDEEQADHSDKKIREYFRKRDKMVENHQSRVKNFMLDVSTMT